MCKINSGYYNSAKTPLDFIVKESNKLPLSDKIECVFVHSSNITIVLGNHTMLFLIRKLSSLVICPDSERFRKRIWGELCTEIEFAIIWSRYFLEVARFFLLLDTSIRVAHVLLNFLSVGNPTEE